MRGGSWNWGEVGGEERGHLGMPEPCYRSFRCSRGSVGAELMLGAEVTTDLENPLGPELGGLGTRQHGGRSARCPVRSMSETRRGQQPRGQRRGRKIVAGRVALPQGFREFGGGAGLE
jgi:hypothetical protein